MMLEARVRAEEAIEPTVWVEARASLRIVNVSFSAASSSTSSAQSSCSYCCLLFLIQNLQTKYVAKAIAITPPRVPPTIAPTLGPECPPDFDELAATDVVEAASATQDVDAQLSQVCTDNEQLNPVSQVGHDGVVVGHWTHRLKRALRETIILLAKKLQSYLCS